MFSVTIFAVNVMIDTNIDESFSDSDEPVSLKINVVKLVMDNTPVKRLKNKLGMVIRKALFACGVPNRQFGSFLNSTKNVSKSCSTYKNLSKIMEKDHHPCRVRTIFARFLHPFHFGVRVEIPTFQAYRARQDSLCKSSAIC